MPESLVSLKSRNQNITVFGGSGFIGRHLIKRLAQIGYRIKVAGRHPDHAHFLQPLGDVGQIVPWPVDYKDKRSITRAIDNADAVVNLVGILYESGFGNRRQNFTTIHTDLPKTIARIAARLGVTRLIQMSSLGVDKQTKSQYAHSKRQGEIALHQAFPHAVIFRPGIVFGAEDIFFNRFASIARFSPFLPVLGCSLPQLIWPERGVLPKLNMYGSGGPQFQPVFVGDVAEACLQALQSPRTAGKIYELGGPARYRFRDLMALVLRYTHRRRLLIPVSLPLARLMAFCFGMLPKPLLTLDQVHLLGQDNIVSQGALTFEDLGIKPVALEAILPGYLERYRSR